MPSQAQQKSQLQRTITSESRIAGERAHRIASLRRALRHAQGSLKYHEAKEHAAKQQLTRLTTAHGPSAAVAWGLSKVGTHEQPAFSNSGPQISTWIRDGGGTPGEPWCQFFADAFIYHGGGVQLRSGYTPGVVQWARERSFGLQIVHSINLGDLLYYKWPGVSSDFCDHVGMYAGGGRSLEGNTSPGTGGSQNNGGGVYLRHLAERRPYLVAVVRPTYTR